MGAQLLRGLTPVNPGVLDRRARTEAVGITGENTDIVEAEYKHEANARPNATAVEREDIYQRALARTRDRLNPPAKRPPDALIPSALPPSEKKKKELFGD